MIDPRQRHPGFSPTDPPRKRGLGGVPIPPPPEREHGGTLSSSGRFSDPWAQRLVGAAALIGAAASGGLLTSEMTTRDVPSATQAVELTLAMESLEREVEAARKENEALRAWKSAKEQQDLLQDQKLELHAEVLHLLNGHVSPTWKWPEPRLGEWQSGTDNMHRHVRRGGAYPGEK